MLTLNPNKTALVLIDLQNGILANKTAPYSSDVVLQKGKDLAEKFRQAGAPVVLVHVGWNAQFSDAPKGEADQAAAHPEGGLPEGWMDFAPGLQEESDLVVLKHQWGAFTGTGLDLQLRRRGIDTIVIGGVATNIGVESTVRHGWELNYNMVVVEDACATFVADQHKMSMDVIFPRIAKVVTSEDIAL
ncbi:hydrolase [Celerinatantimonas sp. MCCC 1A17872]|uniref:hydrolase n=1 Tax=Celerinatantimonas sp. MCCC 1A17872 TaxID=3177514 RepID=UPI0038C7F2B9